MVVQPRKLMSGYGYTSRNCRRQHAYSQPEVPIGKHTGLYMAYFVFSCFLIHSHPWPHLAHDSHSTAAEGSSLGWERQVYGDDFNITAEAAGQRRGMHGSTGIVMLTSTEHWLLENMCVRHVTMVMLRACSTPSKFPHVNIIACIANYIPCEF